MPRLSASTIPLFIQTAAIVAAGVLVIITTVLTSNTIYGKSDKAGRESDAALLAAHMDAQIHDLVIYLETLGTQSNLDLNLALKAHDAMLTIDQSAASLTRLVETTSTQEMRTQASAARVALVTFFASQLPADLARAQTAIQSLNGLLEGRLTDFDALADADQDDLQAAAGAARFRIIVTSVIAAVIVSLMSLIIGLRQRHVLDNTARERDQLSELSAAIQKRNDQFSALYQVVGEVSDNLSMRYVVNTTVTEAGKLVKADYVELRLLEEDSLEIRGSMQTDPDLVASGEPLPLGIGLAGRAAKRGKTIRLDSGTEASMADSERVAGIESGIVVPLIVGARVVGTLACWSREIAQFDADDERILELMATQVATAVAAADMHETSERRASHDALTGLPNRRQLMQDSPELQQGIDSNRRLAVVMLDIDHFKRFNDDFGHRVGDVTLQKVADVMKDSIRESDMLYRYGGEEFLLVLPDVRPSEALRLTERLRRAVAKTVLTGEHLEPVGPVTISGGIALAPDHGNDLDFLIKEADEALYVSKESGRNRITVIGATQKAAAA